MNLQGDFEGSFLTSILQLLCDDQNTGILQVTCGLKECKVFFKKGAIVYVQSSQKEARLGAILKRDSLITEDQLQKALTISRKTKVALGKILVEKEYLSQETLFEYNKKQAEEILYSSLFWEKGKFKYQDTPLKFEGMLVTRLNPMKLILEASRRIDEMSVLTELITSDTLVYKKTDKKHDDQEEFEFSATEKMILSLIDENRTVREIISKSHFEEFAVYKALYALLSSGLIEQSLRKKESDDGLDLGFILSIYTDLLKVIAKPLAVQSGKETTLLIEEIKEHLPRPQEKVLHKFHFHAPASINRKYVRAACKKATGDKIQQRLLLVDSLNGLCHHLLTRMIPKVDHHFIYEAIQEIDQVMDYVDKFQKSSVEKDKIISDMKNILDDTIKQIRLTPQEKKKRGFFSFLKK